jgi:hypothetical protein
MPFNKQLLPICPSCKEPGLRVIETRVTLSSTRRRRQCDFCKHRVTTHEVSEQFLNEAKDNASALVKIRSCLGYDGASSSSSSSSNDYARCFECEFEDDNKCSLGLPEFGTSEAADCNLFEEVR